MRFEVISQIKQNTKHVQTGVLLIPLIPFLCDSDEALEELVKSTKNAGADYLLFGGGMTLRDRQALWFLKHLKERFPELVSGYEQLYGFSYDSQQYDGDYAPPMSYLLPRHKRLFELCKKYQLSYRMKRFIPEDYRKTNYLIAEKLLNEAYEKQMLGKYWNHLFWAGQNIQNLTESIEAIAERADLATIRNVKGDIKEKVQRYLAEQSHKVTKSQS